MYNVYEGRQGVVDFWASIALNDSLGYDNFYVNSENEQVSRLYFNVYKHYFNCNNEIEFVNAIPLSIEEENTLKCSIKWFDLLQRRMKPFNVEKNSFVYSFIHNDTPRGIPFDIQINNGINIHDSRNFKSEQEMIDKIEAIKKSKYYLGSDCSWTFISKLFGCEVYLISKSNTII